VPPGVSAIESPSSRADATTPLGAPRKAPPRDITGLADRLEPSASHEVLPSRKRRTGLWVGLGVLVCAAGAAVAFLMTRETDKTRPRGEPEPKVASGSAVKPYLPPGLAITGSVSTADVIAHATGAVATDEITRSWETLRDDFARLAKDQGIAPKLPTPLTIVAVPAHVLCDARTFESGEVPSDCVELGVYYRPAEQTVLVVDEPATLVLHLGVGLTEVACLNDESSCALKAPFERSLREDKGS
jgi:hypothetical protein